MAELTKLEDKLAEVMGLAMAAKGATTTVAKLVDDEDIVSTLGRMREEAAETETRCEELAVTLDGRKTAIREKARETKGDAVEMMSTYLGQDAEGLDGLEFLVMAEAGEVGHWEVLGALAERAGDAKVRELVSWALPIQERHLATVRDSATRLASREDPNEPA
jgi:hypothetical protein